MPFRPLLMTKLMLRSRRAPLTRTPADAGLAYEQAKFRASDGVALEGWFVPAPGVAPAIVFVHGWMWNRLGNVAGQVPVPDKDVDFLPATRALHDAGYHVLLFDLRNHGRSGRRLPITFGVREAFDVQGALAYLRSRADVDNDRLGLLGCSMGANACLYGTPDAQPVKAILAVQATRVAHFNHNYALDEIGRLGPVLMKPVDPLYRLLGAPLTRDHNPAKPAARLGDTLVQYVQGTGDPWGEMVHIEAFAAATPNVLPIVKYESAGRYEGYRYVNEQVEEVADFFRTHV